MNLVIHKKHWYIFYINLVKQKMVWFNINIKRHTFGGGMSIFYQIFWKGWKYRNGIRIIWYPYPLKHKYEYSYLYSNSNVVVQWIHVNSFLSIFSLSNSIRIRQYPTLFIFDYIKLSIISITNGKLCPIDTNNDSV
jgi:hypothetical protein